LAAAYRRQYVRFVGDLRSKYPRARFLLMGSDRFIGEVRRVADDLNKGSGQPVRIVQFGGLDLQGCDWHPSLADHQRLANLIESEIVSLKPW